MSFLFFVGLIVLAVIAIVSWIITVSAVGDFVDTWKWTWAETTAFVIILTIAIASSAGTATMLTA